MNDVKDKTPIGSIIIIVVFFGIILFFAWQSYSTPLRTFMNLSITSILITILYISSFEWNPLHINPNFISADGAIGVVVSKPSYIGSRQYKMQASVKKRYVDKPKYFTGWQGFMTMLSSNVAVEVTGYKEDFLEVPSIDAIHEGAIIYKKTLKGNYPSYKDIQETLDLKELQTNLVKLATTVERAKSTMVAESGEANRALMEVSQSVTTIMNELKSKDTVILPGMTEQRR